MFRLDSVEVTGDLVKTLINKHNITRETKLKQYYDGEHDILNRKFEDPTKPNNRIVTNFCQYITNVSVGYFVGKPVSYSCQDKTYMEQLQDIFDLNDEQQTNAALAKSASIYGYGVEILYTKPGVNDSLEIRFDDLDLSEQNIILVYDHSVEKNLIAAIRYYDYEDLNGDSVTETFVYTADTIYQYTKTDDEFALVDEQEHFFGEVPINPYFNKDGKGDFEDVISLNDSYNSLESDDVNESNYSNDAYLVIKGMMADDQDVQKMKERRVLEVDGDGDVSWLIKDINDTWKENLKTRIQKDIHKISSVPDLSDENFSGNASGISILYKLIPFENNRASKERNFKQSLQRRNRLITNILNIQGNSYNWRDVTMDFTPNLPTNLVEEADFAIKLNGTGLVSKDTLRNQLSFIEDSSYEEQKIQDEKDELMINLDNVPLGGEAIGGQPQQIK